MRALHDGLVLPVLGAFRGTRVKSVGDAYLALFDAPTEALLCATAVQDRLWAYDRQVAEAERVDVRVAIAMGEVSLAGGDVFGEAVNLAARIEGEAESGEILVRRGGLVGDGPGPRARRGHGLAPAQGVRRGRPGLPRGARGGPGPPVRRRRARLRARAARAGSGGARAARRRGLRGVARAGGDRRGGRARARGARRLGLPAPAAERGAPRRERAARGRRRAGRGARRAARDEDARVLYLHGLLEARPTRSAAPPSGCRTPSSPGRAPSPPAAPSARRPPAARRPPPDCDRRRLAARALSATPARAAARSPRCAGWSRTPSPPSRSRPARSPA